MVLKSKIVLFKKPNNSIIKKESELKEMKIKTMLK